MSKLRFPSWFAKQKLVTKITLGCVFFVCFCLAVVPPLIVINIYRSPDHNPYFDLSIENGEVNIEIDFSPKYEEYFRLENVSDEPGFYDLEFKFDPSTSSWWVRHDRLFWRRFSKPKYTAGALTIDFSIDKNIFITYPSGYWAFP